MDRYVNMYVCICSHQLKISFIDSLSFFCLVLGSQLANRASAPVSRAPAPVSRAPAPVSIVSAPVCRASAQNAVKL